MTPLYLAGMGVRTGLGTGLALHRDKLAEGHNLFRRQRTYLGSDFKPQLTAFDGEIGDHAVSTRLLALGQEAIEDLRATDPRGAAPRHIVVVLPEHMQEPGLTRPNLEQVGQQLARMAGANDPTGCPILTTGAAGVAFALQDFARSGDANGDLLILAIDSYRDRARLNCLLARGHLFSGRDRYGLIPGEAAVIVRVSKSADAQALAAVTGMAVEVEPVREFDDGGTDYAAMTNAAATALPISGGISCWITDWNNSRYRAAELSYSELRLRRRLGQSAEIAHSPLIFGDVGAAALGVGLVMGVTQPSCLLTVSSSGSGARAALSLKR
ncbi:MAG: hypothetical protein Q4G24_16125 [Paracoccus sp. (in: a-proteobacteria)]|uniref:hypothetical protein n=1 Tax=Paracoccus sp. TaxID=267 RepID=UPI0026DF1D83|nr:hypothetical protein [Paracoccus sp. (in: a-proteobacteria)]MDO5622974.1 hypothetical protein [Paracoccus sp. (in: a-proteobacteria)]